MEEEASSNENGTGEPSNEQVEKEIEQKTEEEANVNGKVDLEPTFKKPLFIGPRKGILGFGKPKVASGKSTSEDTETKQDDSSCGNKDSGKKELPKDLPPLAYDEPEWAGVPSENYSLEELKCGVIQRTVELGSKSSVAFGRIENCDVLMAHPSVSRHHAVLQYRARPDNDGQDNGYYIYDLGSTHGTFLNKARIKSKMYVRVRVGHMLKFGCSTRFFILQGPPEDEEEESELSVTELKEKRKREIEDKQREEEEAIKQKEEEEEEQQRLLEERGVSWGMGEDADEEEDLSENPYAVTTNEELYAEDPKKALKHWFDREGEELEFTTEQAEKGHVLCKITLPVDDGGGQEVVVECSARSKKDAQLQCALEACRTIDKLGLFNPSKRGSKKRQKRNWEDNDYYDSDEDSFLDRTGDLDKKREKRMRKAGKINETVDTYETLMFKHEITIKKLEESELKLNKLLKLDNQNKNSDNNCDEVDALDAFMNTLKHDRPNKLDIKIAKDEVLKLKKEEEHLRKLVNFTKPTSMPDLKPFYKNNVTSSKEIEEEATSQSSGDTTDRQTAHSDDDQQSIRLDKEDNDETGSTSGGNKSHTSEETKRVIGPAPPRPEDFDEKPKSKKIKKMPKKPNEAVALHEEDFNNLVWKPPQGQTGDGRTSLNDKLGY